MYNKVTGTLTSTAPIPINCEGLLYPITITVNSIAAGRLIRIKTSPTGAFFPFAYEYSDAAMLVLVANVAIFEVEITGQSGDTYSIL